MADLFVGPVMEKLIDACFEYLKDQVKWQTGMQEELQSLRHNHPKIKSVVSAYSQVEIEDPNLNKWLWQLRDAIDEADDVFDEFEYWRREKEASKKRKISKVRSLMKSLKKRFVKIYKRALKIDPNLRRLEVAVQKLYNISGEVSTFLHLLDSTKQEQQQKQLELHKKRETGPMPTDDLVGRSEDMEYVKQWLRKPCPIEITDTNFYRNISVLSVVGLGGMGKTTLLQNVYKEVSLNTDGMTEGFDVKIWVCVSTNFDASMVIKNMLESLKKERPNLETLTELQNSLESEVMSKRFLLVLDDIWEDDETEWKNVLAPLRNGSSGSKILITTRLDSVASMFAKIIKKRKETLPLKGLDKNECLQIFNTHAFAGEENPDDKLRSIAGEMIEKLSGSPLAAKVIGGILNFNLDESYWTKVLNTNIGHIGLDRNHLLPILKLSYIYLPKYLQNCFTFCCVFPQDHEFDKDDLVRMWIGLGFIQCSNIQGESLEETGRRYFKTLVQKSFFDEFRIHDDKVCYKMHDLLHELAQFVSTQECLRIVDDKELPITIDTIRHLSVHIHRNSTIEAAFQKIEKFKNLRSLILSFSDDGKFDRNVISEIFKTSKTIRLLVIDYRNLLRLPKTIGCLIHLRYLKVKSSACLKPSKSISHLYHLQFLISNELRSLEMDITGRKELKMNENCQLIMDELLIEDPSVLLIEPLRSISSFRFLTILGNDKLVSFPTETEQWFQQHSSSLFRLTFEGLESLQSLPSSLESLSSLEFLRVSYVPQLNLLPNPPVSLTTLMLYNLESLQCLPSLSTISSLKDLELKKITLLNSLPDLPSSLAVIEIEELQKLDCLPSCLPASLFRLCIIKVPLLLKLPELPSSLDNLELRELESLHCLPPCVPTTLRSLTINKVPQLLELPDLPASLEILEIEDCHLQLMERYPNFRRW